MNSTENMMAAQESEPVISGENLKWDYATRNKYTVLLAQSEIGEFYITPQAGQARYVLVYHEGQFKRHMQTGFSIARLIDTAEAFVASRQILPVEVAR